MSVITDIRERRGVVEIVAEGATVARVRKEHFERCPLRKDEDVDIDAYLGRVAAAQLADAYEAALTGLEACARSAKELSGALLRKGYVGPAVEAVMARLSESGLIDDRRYAERMAQLQASRPVGLYAFKRKLRSKGISREDAEEALAVFDDAQQQAAALEAARKLYGRYESLPQREARSRLSQALARRGFPWDAVEGAVDALFDE